MRKSQQRELERLERALMEEEDNGFYSDQEDRKNQPFDYDMYNVDDADVDMEDYSEEVYGHQSGRKLSVAVTMVAMVALAACILLLLQMLGVL